MKTFFKYIKPHIWFFILGPIFMICEVVGEVIMPKLVSLIIDNGIGLNDMTYVIKTGVMMILVALMMMAGGVVGNLFAVKASGNFAYELRGDLFKKIQKFSFKNIDEFSTGSLITRLTNDITQIQNVIRMSLVMLLRAPGMLIGALIMAISINKKLALIIALVIPVLAFSVITIMIKAFGRFSLMQKKIDNLNQTVGENLTNVRVVKSFVREEYEEEKFENANGELYDNTLKAMHTVIKNGPIMTLLMNVTTILVVWFGGNFVVSGFMGIGSLTAFTTYIVQILMSLMMVSMIILNASRALASLRRIKEVLNAKVDITDDNTNESQVIKNGKIEFKNVSFSYTEDKKNEVLTDISFTINPGETIGIIGPTGSGKTTLISLIARLYDVQDGEILIDDVNVKDYKLKNLRDKVGVVMQKNTLFSGSIKENLLYANENATDDEIIYASKLSQAHNFIEGFKDSYDTFLGQGGVNLSGGQKQRICIARAILKNPKILILDDSTSAVDTATEAKIRYEFKNSLKDMTKIIIAQRISSIMDADNIIVLDDGKIIAIGNHDELLKSCDEYKEFYYIQKEEK